MNDLAELERELGGRLRTTFDTVLTATATPDLDDPHFIVGDEPAALPLDVRPARTQRQPTGALAIAAAMLLVVGAGAVYVASTRERPTVDGSTVVTVPADNTLPAIEPVPTQVPVTTAPPDTGVVDTDTTRIWLPTEDIPGYTLSDLSVTRGDGLGRRASGTVRYDRRGADGKIEASIFVRLDNSQGGLGTTAGKTIHGQPAMVFDSGEGIVVAWPENGFVVFVRGVGLDEESVIAASEGFVIRGTPSAFEPPEPPNGFEQPSVSDAASSAALTVSLNWRPDTPQPGVDISFNASPNVDNTTPDQIEFDNHQSALETERVTVHSQPAILATSNLGPYGPMRFLSWIEDGTYFTVIGRTPTEQLLALAEGLAPATLDDARAERQFIDHQLVKLAALDRGTLPNGFVMSVRTTGTGANAMCVEVPELTCEQNTSESSIAGDNQAVAVLTFVVDGKPWLIGWAEGTHQPHSVVQSKAPERMSQTVQGSAGTFFAMPFVDESTQVMLDPGDQTMYGGANQGAIETLV